MRRADFKKTGRLGCADCYEAFSGELLPLIKAMHRADQHAGKVPERERARVRQTAEVEELRQALERAVAAEKYEEAARLRDLLQRRRARDGGEAEPAP